MRKPKIDANIFAHALNITGLDITKLENLNGVVKALGISQSSARRWVMAYPLAFCVKDDLPSTRPLSDVKDGKALAFTVKALKKLMRKDDLTEMVKFYSVSEVGVFIVGDVNSFINAPNTPELMTLLNSDRKVSIVEVKAFNKVLSLNVVLRDIGIAAPKQTVISDTKHPKKAVNAIEKWVLEYLCGDTITPNIMNLAKRIFNLDNEIFGNLFSVIAHHDVEITKAGDLILYKFVSEDFTDIYTGTFDNSIGATVKMPREEVVRDPTKSCEAGLHVCTTDYIHHTIADKKTVKVLVKPENIVSVPHDYKNSKLRVSEYKVLEEVTLSTTPP